MATLTGRNFISSFITAYDEHRAVNVDHSQGWDGDIYYFQKTTTYNGNTFTSARMEVEGDSLMLVDGELTGTVETMRLSGRANQVFSDITDLSLSAETLSYYMLWAGRGDSTIQRHLEDYIEGAITTFVSVGLEGSEGNSAIYYQGDFTPETVYLRDGDELTIYDEQHSGVLNVFGSSGIETLSFTRFDPGTIFDIGSGQLLINDLTIVFDNIENVRVNGHGLTVRGNAFDADVLIADRPSFTPRSPINRLEGRGGDDTLFGGNGKDVLDGGADKDRLFGGKGDDLVYGGDGNDYVRVGGGTESFYGGDGKDYISYCDSTGGITIDLDANTVTGSWANNDVVHGFESVSGSKTGDDKVYGTSGSNTIKTYGGDDKVYAGSGKDRVYLGDGNDYVRVGGGTESFFGGDGKDYISYYDSAGGITIDLQADSVTGSWGNNDVIAGFESVSGSKAGGDKVYGTSGSNTVKSYGGDDSIWGRSGDDKLYGGNGDDRFDGGHGDDTLWGGDGADTFHFDHSEDSDIIKDFENNIDTIQLDNFGYANVAEALSYATESGGDVIFDFGDGDTLVVENTSKAALLNDLEIV